MAVIRKSAKSILLWSALLAALGTAGGFWFEHPGRVAPAALGAIACPVLLVSYCKVIWRMRKRESSLGATRAIYEDNPVDKAVTEWGALIFFLLIGSVLVFIAFIFNLLHTFNME